MSSLNDRIGSQNVIRVLSNASAAPTRVVNLTDVNSALKTQDGMILVWDLTSSEFVMTNTIDSSEFIATGIVTFSNTTDSTSTTDGALSVSGGLGVVKNLNVGGDVTVAGIATFGSGAITINGDTNVISIGSSIAISEAGPWTIPGAIIPGEVNISGATTLAGSSGIVTTGNDLYVGDDLFVKGNIQVGGESEFVGIATFKGGIVKLGDDPTDDIDIGGEFVSSLVPNDDNTYDIGIATQRWRDGNFAGFVSANELNVAGLTTLTGIVTTGNRLYVGEHLFVQGDLSVVGPVILDNLRLSEINVTGIATASELNVTGIATVSELTVTGLSTFTGIATFTQDVFVDGTLTAGLIDGGSF